MGIDNTTILPVNSSYGRNAIHVETKHRFNSGLVILSVDHVPTGPGLWPAFWMYGPKWPIDGEVDIMESVDEHYYNQISFHTGDGCFMQASDSKFFSGQWLAFNDIPQTHCASSK